MYSETGRVWLSEDCAACGGNIYLVIDEYRQLFKKCLQCSREFSVGSGLKRYRKLMGIKEKRHRRLVGVV